VSKSSRDFPAQQKEKMTEYNQTTNLNGVINPTRLTSFRVVNLFDDLIVDVLKVMNNAKKQIYFATRYHDPHVSVKVFENFSKGVTIHVLDGNPEQISVKSRLALIEKYRPRA
jgi:hypothetical protein